MNSPRARIASLAAALSWPRIIGTSLTVALHIAVLLGLTLTQASPPPLPDSAEVVTVVDFIPASGSSRLVVAPPPPPEVAPRQAPKAVTKATPAKPSPPPVDDGELAATDAAAEKDAKASASKDLPVPDYPPSEILSYREAHQPVYPPEAREAGESGWVTLRVLVDADGLPLTAVVVRSTATQRLAQSAMDAVLQWRFNPALKNGTPITAWIEVPIGFFNSRRVG